MGSRLGRFSRSIRPLIREPNFALLAALTLGLGVGANTAIFTIVDEIYLRPLPIDEPRSLVRVYSSNREDSYGEFSYPDYLNLRDAARSYSGLAAYSRKGVALDLGGQAEVVPANIVSDNYFGVLGVKAAIGATSSDRSSNEPRVIIGHDLWRRYFSADPEAVGRSIRINNRSCTIGGVLPRGFHGADRFFAPQVWVPLDVWSNLPNESETLRQRGARSFFVIGRLAEGTQLSQASAETAWIGRNLADRYPETNRRVEMSALSESGSQPRALALVSGLLMATGGLVLLIGCANLANLLSVRIAARRREIATRAALGAGRARIVGELSAEVLWLSLLGSCVGLVLASWSVDLLPGLFPPLPLSVGFDFRLDLRAIAFALALSLITALLTGLPAAVRASGGEIFVNLKDQTAPSRRLLRRRRIPWLTVFVSSQLAVSMVLLTVMGLLVRTLWNTKSIDPGFNRDQDMLVLQLSPGTLRYTEGQTRAFYRRLVDDLRSMPGVRGATLARRLPLSPLGGGVTMEVSTPGQELPPGNDAPRIHYTSVGTDYFRAMGTRILLGRAFSARDRESSPSVVIVNETMARRFWAGDNPVGKHLRLGGPDAQSAEIVGVAQDGKYQSLIEAPLPYMYVPLSQDMAYEATLLVQTRGDPRGLAVSIREEIAKIDEGIPTFGLMTLREHLRHASFQQSLVGSLVGTLGVLGLILSIVGVYGVVSYSASRRASEFVVRMALGAQRSDILKHVLRTGLVMTAGGVSVGLACSFAATGMISSLLFEVSPIDPITFVTTALCLAVVALAACAKPALRATRADPVRVLRAQ